MGYTTAYSDSFQRHKKPFPVHIKQSVAMIQPDEKKKGKQILHWEILKPHKPKQSGYKAYKTPAHHQKRIMHKPQKRHISSPH
jgi:hypothetical protein